MASANPLTTGARDAAFDDRLSNDLEQVDIALMSNPSRFERVWLRVAKRVLDARIPDSEVMR